MNEDSATKTIINLFKRINSIPRCSKREEKIANYLLDWAKERKLQAKKDRFKNVVIDVPATAGFEIKESVVIQGHMDMVCEKTAASKHDFSKDPIKTIEDGDWLRAEDTTLGADDGIALAIGLAIASDENIKHPKLELLFTADEETGLNGAKNLQPGFFKSKKIINIDSETEGVFTIGCAGGEDTDITLPIKTGFRDGYFYEIKINGLLGGHSGTEIGKQRANAIKLMINFLKNIEKDDIKLSLINGGSARNAIPQSSRAVICSKNKIKPEAIVAIYKEILEKYTEDNNIKIDLKQLEEKRRVILNSHQIIELLSQLPHGVYEKTDNELVKISNNLAKVETKEDCIKISSNQRSLTEEGLNTITRKIEKIAEEFNAEFSTYNRYPSWQPNYNSYILKKSTAIYEKLFGEKPKINVIHAGLECGILGSKNKDMDMISIGPTMRDVHTPNEKLYIPSLEKIWVLLINILKEI